MKPNGFWEKLGLMKIFDPVKDERRIRKNNELIRLDQKRKHMGHNQERNIAISKTGPTVMAENPVGEKSLDRLGRWRDEKHSEKAVNGRGTERGSTKDW